MDVIKAISDLQSHSTSNAASMAQKAAVEALTGPQNSVSNMVAEFHKRRDYMVEQLNALPGIHCAVPQGAFYVFPNISGLFGKSYKSQKIENSAQLAQLLLSEARVALVPGNAFGAEGHLRISYATSMARIEAGLGRIKSFVQELV
jgi:aspartate aminotransferase